MQHPKWGEMGKWYWPTVCAASCVAVVFSRFRILDFIMQMFALVGLIVTFFYAVIGTFNHRVTHVKNFSIFTMRPDVSVGLAKIISSMLLCGMADVIVMIIARHTW